MGSNPTQGTSFFSFENGLPWVSYVVWDCTFESWDLSIHVCINASIFLHVRGFPFLDQHWTEGDVKDDFLDLARYWLQAELDVVIERHGGGIAHHVDGVGGKDLSLARCIHLSTEKWKDRECIACSTGWDTLSVFVHWAALRAQLIE